jgi:hypothetical protein
VRRCNEASRLLDGRFEQQGLFHDDEEDLSRQKLRIHRTVFLSYIVLVVVLVHHSRMYVFKLICFANSSIDDFYQSIISISARTESENCSNHSTTLIK